jgi:aspartyl-tRNA(Asn)/glutamyl-tRNA(Gln) amidotransferase subunit B
MRPAAGEGSGVAERGRIAHAIVIGLEVHIELRTASKMFCACPNAFGREPNTAICPVCLGLPGALPVPNAEAVRLAVRFGAAVGAEVRPGKFDRKNYFYPDLPKGYQISQFDLPICVGGTVHVPTADGGERPIRLVRAHLEEDAGKLFHSAHGVRVDYNRAGVPLLEVVSQPDLRSPEEARLYFEELRLLALRLGISDARMQEGSLRADANISLRPDENAPYGTRVEVKNLNSFRAVERAMQHEALRQARLLDEGMAIRAETRGWDEERGVTYALRDKEGSEDYRYFPDPDLPPLALEPAMAERERASLPELPHRVRQRLVAAGVRPEDARLLASRPAALTLVDAAHARGAPLQAAATWLLVDGARIENAGGAGPGECALTGEALAGLIDLAQRGAINAATARGLFERLWREGGDPATIVAAEGLASVSDPAVLREAAEKAIAAHPQAVADVRAGKAKAIGPLVGSVMRATGGRAPAAEVERLIRELVGEEGGRA